MMPPKKSKAARSALEGTEVSHVAPAPVENGHTADIKEEDDSDTEHTNIFKVEIVEGKRPRMLPASEIFLQKWLTDNLSSKEEVEAQLKESDVYEHYLEGCVGSGAMACGQTEFMKVYKKTFPKGVEVKESSPYHDEIRVKKPKKERSKKPKAETFSIKIKDIVMTAFDELGDREQGIRFNTLKQHIAAKFPALRVDTRPKFLLNLLEKWVFIGQIDRVKGVGLCGHYRKPVEETLGEGDKENKDAKKVKKEKKEKKGDEEKTEDSDDSKENKQKEEKGEGDAENQDDKEDDEEKDDEKEETEGEGGKRTTKKKKDTKKGDAKKSKGKKKAAPKKQYRSFVMHSDPQRIEDTFDLAMTFMVEPKEASVKKILSYIEDYYCKTVGLEKFRNCLESGIEKGYWDQVTGTGMSGKYRLLMDEFDPSADDDLIGQVMNAMVACTEPKQCGAGGLKNYLLEYHPQFKIAERPHLYKSSLIRALKKNKLRQLTGIGATGTYQLAYPFTPTPTILRGEDKEDDYASSDTSEDDVAYVSEDDGQGYGKFHISTFQDAYNPRPTKKRGHGRVASTGLHDEPLANKVKKSYGRFRSTAARDLSTQPKRKQNKPKRRKDDSDDDSEDNVPVRRKKGARSSSRKQRRVSYKAKESESSNEEDTDSEDSAPPPPVKKATARKPPQKRGKDSSENEDSEDEAPKKSKGRGLPQKKSKDSSEDEDSEDEAQKKKPTPKKSTKKTPSRGSSTQNKKRISRTPQITKESSGDEDSEDEAPKRKATLKRTPKRGASGGRSSSRTPTKRGLYTEPSEDEDEEDEAPPAKRQAPKKASPEPRRAGRTPQKRGKNTAASDEEDEDSEEEKVTKGRQVPRKVPKVESNDDDSEEEAPKSKEKTPVKKSPAKRKKGKGRRR